jgi:[NiFe] hydrogenase diaphorase moiety small subunit
MTERPTFLLDGVEVPFDHGQTVMQAALTAGRYIPHLCYHPEFKPHGSCKVCTAKVNRPARKAVTAACRRSVMTSA